MNRMVRVIAALVALQAASGAASAATLGNAFTYQGALNQGGSPANGVYDFTFRLYDAAAGGNVVGSLLTVSDVPVTNGVFTVGLDFGAGMFTDQARWLEISVRPDGPDPYTLLTPRQPLATGPVAQYALEGGSWRRNGDVLYNTNDDKSVLVNRNTRITASEYFGIDAPTTSYGGMYINTSGLGEPFYGYAQGGVEKAWTYVDGSTGAWRLNIDGADRFTVLQNGSVGIGTVSPSFPLHIIAPSVYSLYVESTKSDGRGIYAKGPEAGVYGYSGAGWGIAGSTTTGYGVYGSNGNSNVNGYAGYFSGRVRVTGNVDVVGNLTKSSGTFKIDHPLDPANKTLSHSFVESPDMMNLYNGNVTTDAEGRATITLPEWFGALNRDFRYQLTPIRSFARAMVEQEIEGNRFVIRTEEPNVRVSWQVSGVRQDPWAKDHPIPVEAEKPAAEKGTYLYPAGYAKAGAGPAQDAARAAAVSSASKGGR